MDYSSNKRIAKNTIYLYLRMIVSLGIGLYTSRAFLHALGVVDYGIYNIVGGFVAMLAIFTGTITSAAQRFITFRLGDGNMELMRNTFATILVIIIVFSVLILILGEIVGLFVFDGFLVIPQERIDIAYFVYHCSLVAFILNLIAVPYIACVTAHEHMNAYAVLSILESVLKLAIVFFLYVQPYDRLGVYALLYVMVSLIVRLLYSVYCRIHFEEVKSKLVVDKTILRDLLSYSTWVTIGASSYVLKEQGVNVVINLFYGVVMNTARGVSSQVSAVLSQFSNSIGQAISPQITKNYASGDLDRSIELTFLLTKAQGIMVFLVALPLMVETDYILNIWLVEVPVYAVIFTRWGLALSIVRTLESTHGPIFLASGKVRNLQIIGGGVMLLNLPLSYLALKLGYPPESTMIVGIVVEAVVMMICYTYLHMMINFPYIRFFQKIIIPLLCVYLLSSIITFTVHRLIIFEGIDRFIIVGLTSTVCISLLSYWIILNSNERNVVNRIILKRILAK